MLESIITFVTSQPATFWQAAATVLVSGGAIAWIVQLIKKHLIEHSYTLHLRLWPSKRRLTIATQSAVMVLLAGMTLLASAGDYLITNNPAPAGGEITGLASYLFTAAVILHRFTVSPQYRGLQAFLSDIKTERARRRTAPSLSATDAPALER